MTKFINDISEALTQTEVQAKVFQRAAYFNGSADIKPFQSIREGGNRNQFGAGSSEFKKLIAGGYDHDLDLKEEIEEADESMQKSSHTIEGEKMVNIDIVELH